MKILYIADDGTQFHDEDECLAYENRINKWSKITKSRFWDVMRVPMTIEQWLDDPETCDYMDVANDEEAALIREYLRDVIGLCHPWPDYHVAPTAGRYYYSHDDDEWHRPDTELAMLTQIMETFEG